ncbi:hypothetical protein [Enterococcus sp. DIV0187]|uniref:hypothetical protein n=1 Tax=Enterococcus sp. DIV0187 TaxID=2774644 RepID=UPI003F28CFB0
MKDTGEEKYCDPIKSIKFSKSYLSNIKEIAEAIIDFDPELTEEIYNAVDDETKKMFRDIRLDTDNQRIQNGDIGDYVILVVANILRDEKKKINYITGKGKYLKASDKLISKVLLNDKNKGNISEFCRNNGIQRSKYYRILKRNFKHQSDVERINKIAESVI